MRWSAAAYFDYTRHTPSLASLVVANPDVLPPELRRAYEADPSRFLVLNRDLLPTLLGGIALPETRGLHTGLRFQGVFSRYNLSGEVRYSAGDISAREQRNFLTTFGLSVRLDAANSVQLSGARTFALSAPGGQTAFTISYVHRFGAAAGDGFQFSKLLGLDRGHIEGRVFFDLNGNGRDDAGEPGVADAKVQMDGDRGVTTDERGRFHFPVTNPGEYNVALRSDDLGVRLRASTATEQHVSLSARQTARISFGVTNHGFVAGRVFNDLHLTGETPTAAASGIGGVCLRLRPAGASGAPLTQTLDASGLYEFRNLAPGNYTLELDPTTLPPDFRMPAQTSWPVTVKALQGSYLDIPLAAQRAIAGIVFIDKDGDGRFDSQKDQPVAGVRVTSGSAVALSGPDGTYVLRNLPAGQLEISARAPWGVASRQRTIELGAGPTTQDRVNLALPR